MPMPTMVKVEAYSFFTARIRQGASKSKEAYTIITSKTKVLLNVEELQQVTRRNLEIMGIKNFSIENSGCDRFIVVNDNQANIKKSEVVTPYCKESVLDVSLKLINTREFYYVTLKHPVMTGLGINGTDYSQRLIIDKDSWLHLMVNLEGDINL